jgi:hypothetical protein
MYIAEINEFDTMTACRSNARLPHAGLAMSAMPTKPARVKENVEG